MENPRFSLDAITEKYKRVSLKFMRLCSALNARLLNKLKFLRIKEKNEYQICSNRFIQILKSKYDEFFFFETHLTDTTIKTSQ